MHRGVEVSENKQSSKRGIITIVVVFGGMFLMFFLFAAVMIAAMGEDGLGSVGGDRIGVIEITGPIMESKKTVADLRKFERDENIKGIVVRVNSPGGAVAPSQEIFHAVKRAKKKKPLAVSMGSTAASGGYYIAIGSDKIFANQGTVTGSIGVITQLFNVSELVEKVDLKVHTVKTGPYKDSGSPFREFDLKDEVYFRQLIQDIYDQFVEDVAAEREMELDKVKEYADGRVFTGRQAKELDLVDEIGTMHDAVKWVADEAKVEGEPKLAYPPDKDSLLNEILKEGMETAVSSARTASTPLIEYRYAGPQ